MYSMVASTWSDWSSTGVSGLEDEGASNPPATAGLLRSCGDEGDTTVGCPWMVCGATADFGGSPAGGGGGAREEAVGFLRDLYVLAATFGFFSSGGRGAFASACLLEEVGRRGAPSLEVDFTSRWMEDPTAVVGADVRAELERVVRLGAGRAERRSDMTPGTEGGRGGLASEYYWRMAAGGTRDALARAPIYLPDSVEGVATEACSFIYI